MNVRLLSRHFPELQEMTEAQQAAVLQQAHERAYAPERKMVHWRRNVISLIWICAVSLFLTLVAGPALGMSDPVMAGVIVVIVLPAFMVMRHRQYLSQLRPEVQAIARKPQP